jgi:hypothetical protein
LGQKYMYSMTCEHTARNNTCIPWLANTLLETVADISVFNKIQNVHEISKLGSKVGTGGSYLKSPVCFFGWA